eukprot:m.415016 g.415016  ORF g.415016 m.415016 type:complete len:1430 (-) comp20177_c0_seq1:148-4437(-)
MDGAVAALKEKTQQKASKEDTTSARRRWKVVGTAIRHLSVQTIGLQQTHLNEATVDDAPTMRVGGLVPASQVQIRAAIDAACEELNLKVEWMDLAEFKASVTHQVDIFMNSDVMIVDKTESENRPFLSFQLGMRESITHGRNPSIVMYEDVDPESTLRLATDRYICIPFTTTPTGELWHTGENMNLLEHLALSLLTIQESLPMHSTKERRFVQGLKRARDPDARSPAKVQELKHLERMLAKDPSMVTQGHLLDLLLTYRDIKDWENMIHLLNVAGRHTSAAQLPQVQYHIAFALNRRNLKDDRQRALHIVNKVCAQYERDGVTDGSQDVWGLKGRIYKDKFIESLDGDVDYKSCEHAIDAYRHVFAIEENLYGGVNLLTLLFASEKFEERKGEIENICSRLNGNVARRGGMQSITDYWDAASFFEINVVGGLWALANQAAPVMYNLAASSWMLETTMRNIQLVDKLRKQRENLGEERHADLQRHEFEFWCEFFLVSLKDDVDTMVRFPVLVQTMASVKPCYVLNHPPTERDESAVELIEVRDDSTKRYPISTIVNLKYINIATHPDFIDKRRVTMTCSAARGFRAFTLCFASEAQRCVFCELTVDGGYVADTDDEVGLEEPKLEWEFDYIGTERRMLGRGANATVYVGLLGDAKEEIAVKEVDVLGNNGPPGDLLEEIRTIRHLQHKNIVKFLGCEQDERVFRLLMECVPGGSMTAMLYRYGGLIGDSTFHHLVEYSAQILEALAYLHGSDIVHRDVKGDNVLVNTYSGTLKLADFGTSKRMAGLNPRTDTLAGTPWYMAPEVIQSDTHDYGREADIWSLGCTVWQMARGKPPLVELRDPEEVMEAIGIYREHEEIPDTWPESLRKFLSLCFLVDPKKRPSADELLRTSFITGMEEQLPPAREEMGRRMSLTIQDMAAARRSPTMDRTTSLTPQLSWGRSLSREVSAGGTYIEPWTVPQKHREILHGLTEVINEEMEQILTILSKRVRQDETISLPQEEMTLRELLAVVTLLMKQEEAQDGWGSISDIDHRIKQLLPMSAIRAAGETRRDPPRLMMLKKVLLHLKPHDGPHPCLLADVLRSRQPPKDIPPHWIFYIETMLTKVICELIKRLQDMCKRTLGGGKQRSIVKRARARSRALSEAAPKHASPQRSSSRPRLTFSKAPSSDSGEESNSDEGKPQVLERVLSNQELIAKTLRQVSSGRLIQQDAVRHAQSVDAKIVGLLRHINVSTTLASLFAKQQVTFDTLLNYMDKDDLKDVGLPIGPRSRIWREVQRLRVLEPSEIPHFSDAVGHLEPHAETFNIVETSTTSLEEHNLVTLRTMGRSSATTFVAATDAAAMPVQAQTEDIPTATAAEAEAEPKPEEAGEEEAREEKEQEAADQGDSRNEDDQDGQEQDEEEDNLVYPSDTDDELIYPDSDEDWATPTHTIGN